VKAISKTCSFEAAAPSQKAKKKSDLKKQSQFLYRQASLSFIIIPILDDEYSMFGKY